MIVSTKIFNNDSAYASGSYFLERHLIDRYSEKTRTGRLLMLEGAKAEAEATNKREAAVENFMVIMHKRKVQVSVERAFNC